MELREIIKIFKENIKLFFGIVLVFSAIGLVVFVFQPKNHFANLTMNVTRKGAQKTEAYRYDDFYRLQADERFADTVVRWIGSPQIIEEIRRGAKLQSLEPLKAGRLSSQMIEVEFALEDKNDAKTISDSVLRVLNLQAEKLNEFQKEDSWFILVANEPFVGQKKVGLGLSLMTAALLGLFFGAWGVMIKNYLKRG